MRIKTALMIAIFATGCVYSPIDGTRVADIDNPITVTGYAGVASDLVVLEALNTTNGTWDAISTTTSTTANINPTGYGLYGYSFGAVAVPASYQEWDCVELRVTENGNVLGTFADQSIPDASGFWTILEPRDCLVGEYQSNGGDWFQAGMACKTGTTFTVCEQVIPQ